MAEEEGRREKREERKGHAMTANLDSPEVARLLSTGNLMNELRRRSKTPEIAELAFFGDEELIHELRRRSNKLLVVWEKPCTECPCNAMIPLLSWAPYTTDGLGLATYAKDRLMQLLSGVDAATRKINAAELPTTEEK